MADKVNSARRCVIIAGAPYADPAFLKSALRGDDYIICADSGFAHAQAAGILPDLLVGDFDSYTGSLPDDCETVRLRPEKDDTDTFHCVNLALQRGFTRFVLLAATGGRLDHTLANLAVPEYLARHGATGEILSETERVLLLTEGTHSFDNCAGLTFSVLPFGCDSAILSYTGAKYPLNHGTLTHSYPMGVSNIFTCNRAAVTVHSGRVLVIINLNAT